MACAGLVVAIAGRPNLVQAEWDVVTDRDILTDIYNTEVYIYNELVNYIRPTLADISLYTSQMNIDLDAVVTHLATIETEATTSRQHLNSIRLSNFEIRDHLANIITYVDELETHTSLIQQQTDELEGIGYQIEALNNDMRTRIESLETLLTDVHYEVTNDPGNPAAQPPPNAAGLVVDPAPPIGVQNLSFTPTVESFVEPDDPSTITQPDLDFTANDTTPSLDFVLATSNFSGIAGMPIQDIGIDIDEQWMKTYMTPIITPILIALTTWYGLLMVFEETRRYG